MPCEKVLLSLKPAIDIKLAVFFYRHTLARLPDMVIECRMINDELRMTSDE